MLIDRLEVELAFSLQRPDHIGSISYFEPPEEEARLFEIIPYPTFVFLPIADVGSFFGKVFIAKECTFVELSVFLSH